MDRIVVAAVVISLVAGIAIGAQGTLVGIASKALGAARTGLLVNLAGGTLALVVLGILAVTGGGSLGHALLRSAPAWGAAGALGIGVLMGIAFALPRLGLAAGLGGIILGQMAAAVIIDAAGWGVTRVPLGPARMLGLALMGVALWLLLPRP